MNAFTEKQLIMKLYEASQAGVKIDLIVRGICCLRPGIKGVSENIRVLSIVGRFLEHSRIYYFHHNGEQKILLASADLMTRNIENRVEIAFPIYDKKLKERIKQILSIYLGDNVKAREQDQYGCYAYVEKATSGFAHSMEMSKEFMSDVQENVVHNEVPPPKKVNKNTINKNKSMPINKNVQNVLSDSTFDS